MLAVGEGFTAADAVAVFVVADVHASGRTASVGTLVDGIPREPVDVVAKGILGLLLAVAGDIMLGMALTVAAAAAGAVGPRGGRYSSRSTKPRMGSRSAARIFSDTVPVCPDNEINTHPAHEQLTHTSRTTTHARRRTRSLERQRSAQRGINAPDLFMLGSARRVGEACVAARVHRHT